METVGNNSVWETQKEMKSESHLCLGPGVFTEDGGLVPMSSQASRNEEECSGVLCKSLTLWNQGS